jgi:hypothetical protein
VVTKELQPFLM